MNKYIPFKQLATIILFVVFSKNLYSQTFVAVNDRVTVFKNEPLTIAHYRNNDTIPIDCAGNDSRIKTHPQHGTVTLTNNQIIYTPATNFIGNDSIQYLLRCNGEQADAWIYITVAEMPDNIDPATCVVEPDPDVWSFTQLNASTKAYTPYLSNLVGDIDNDGVVEVFAVENTCCRYSKFYFLDPTTTGMPEKYALTVCDGGYFSFENALSFADVDKDGYAEIFYTTQQGYLYCIEYDPAAKNYKSTYRWRGTYNIKNSLYKCPSPMIADFNGDGVPEVMVYDRIYNAVTGDLLVDGGFAAKGWNFGLGAMHITNENNSVESLMAVGDLDGDGLPEIAAGNQAYKVNIVSTTDPALNTITLMSQCEPFSYSGDGATALVDMDLDGFLDVVVLRRNGTEPTNGSGISLLIWDPRTGKMLHDNVISDIPSNGTSYGPAAPLIADMDGDGVPEIGVSAYCTLRTYKYNRKTRTITKMWELPTTDGSASTGITLFDFNIDGKAELVYRDETVLRILDGATGSTLTQINNSSCTASEYPVVADVNNDGAAEIIVTGWPSGRCAGQGYVCVYSSNPAGRWAPARKVWNQFAYNTVNINEDLTVPARQFNPASPLTDPATGITRRPYNNFLQQATVFDRYGKPIYPAAEAFTIKLHTVSFGDSVNVTMTIKNQGSIKLQSPFNITIYKDSARTAVVGTVAINQEIPVSEEETVLHFSLKDVSHSLPYNTWVYSLNDGGTGVGQKYDQYSECDTTNNRTIKTPLIANHDRYVVWLNTPADINILKNDVYGCNVTPTIIQNSKHGSFVANSDIYLYTPQNNFYGMDTVQYRLICDGDTAYAYVFLTVAEMPDNIDPATCVVEPDPDVWSFRELNKSDGTYSAHLSTLVGDIDGDGNVEILAVENVDVSSHFYFLDPTQAGMPVKYSFTLCDGGTFAQNNCVSFADVDRDGYAEIFYTTNQGYLYCIEYDPVASQYKTTYRWKQPYNSRNSWYKCPQPMFADFDGDGVPEVMVYDRIYNAVTGDLIVDGNFNANNWNCGLGAMHKTYSSTAPSLMAIGDLDGDGLPDIAAGNMSYKVNIVNASDPAQNSITLMKQSESFTNVGDGATALVDLDLDGELDVVVVRRNGGTPGYGAGSASLFVWNPRTGKILHTNTISDIPTSTGSGGPGIPLIADMDGDGVPEIGVSACNVLRTYKYNKNERKLNVMWSLSTTDGSASTGITLFDFNLDGKSELVYRDQTHLRILDGTTGQNLTTIANSSCTFSEYPVVADVNNDGSAEIIVSGWPSGNCEWRGHICVFSSDPPGRWAPARKVWNQFGYNTVNINEDLTVPRIQFNPASALTDPETGITRRPYNCFLQQATVFDRYGKPIYLATDLAANNISTVAYQNDSLHVEFDITNLGGAAFQDTILTAIYADSSRTTLLACDTLRLTANLENNQTIHHAFTIQALNTLVEGDKYLVFDINSRGKGIAQKDKLQAECDTLNNRVTQPALIAMRDSQYVCLKQPSVMLQPMDNDIFEEGITPTLSIVTNPTKGTAKLIGGVAINYTLSTFEGKDSLYYRIVNGKDTAYTWMIILESPFVAVAADIDAEDPYICLNETATLNATSHLNSPVFTWYADAALTSQLATGASYTTPALSTETTYYVTVQNTDTCENKPFTAREVTVRFYPNKTTDLEDSVCVGSDYTKYNFTIPTQNTAGVYNFTQNLNTSHGCDSTVVLSLKVLNNPQFTLGEDTLVCSALQPTYTLIAPAGYDAYTWDDNTTLPTRTVDATGTYTVQVQKTICFGTASRTVTFHDFRFSLGDDFLVCRGDNFQLKPSQTGTSYIWSNGNTSATLNTDIADTYWLQITDNKGCIFRDTVVVTPVDAPTLTLTGGDNFCNTENRETDTLHIITDGTQFGWENEPNNQNDLFIDVYGTYKAWATNTQGCRSEQSITIEPCPCELFLNNVFSPNGDGKNDTYYPTFNSSVASIEMLIYNRWGILVYETSLSNPDSNSPEPHWDGNTSSGKECQTGVYYCVINYTCKGMGTTYTKHSSVTLIR